MKTLYTLLLVLLIGTVQAQSGEHYTTISEEEYNIATKKTWYQGRAFLTNGSKIDGQMRRNYEEPTIKIKDSEGNVKSYGGFECVGFYLVNHKNDTAFFLFIDLNNNPWNPKFKALRLLIDGNQSKGISLFRFVWLSAEDSWEAKFFRSDVYQINWEYYLWKNGKIQKLTNKKNLKKLMEDKPESLKYFKKYKRQIKNGEYSALSNVINIYNLELY